MTSYVEFLVLPETQSANVQEATLKMWHRIYSWIEVHGYADTADSPDFVHYVQEWRKVGVTTIGVHLGRMAALGLLKRHMLKRKLSTQAREELLNPVLGMFSGANLPTTLSRYTLPGKACPLEFKAAARKAARIESTWTTIAQSFIDKPFGKI